MVRPFAPGDLDRLLDIWLAANCQAHSFIPASYWEGQREAVRQALPQAEVYVWEGDGAPLGFVGLDGGHIAGIFVQPGKQSQGIGRRLLDQAKAVRGRLTLCVYQKNTRAAAFYRREGFQALREQLDPATGERETLLRWRGQTGEEDLC